MNNPGEFDIGPLTWVKGEIDLALNRAGEALKKHAEIAANSGEDAPDVSQIKIAQSHLHQAHGALTIVGLNGVTQFTEAIEQVFAALADGTLAYSAQIEALCQRALTIVSAYLDELLAGAPDQSLRLLSVYRELMAACGVAAAAPADLFFPDLSQRPPRREKEPATLAPEALAARLKAARLGFQRGLLKWLKGEAKGLTEMRNSMAVIEFTQVQPAARAFWWIARGFLDALIAGGVPVDAAVKKLCGRIDAQIAKLLEGSNSVAERLNREALYYVATSTVSTDHIECVRAAYRLADLIPATAGGVAAVSPHMAQLRAMRDTLDSAKEEWNRYTSQIPSALGQFQAHAKQLAEQGQGAGQMDLARLVAGISAVANMLAANATQEVDDSMALEIATSLLLVENALERFGQLGVDFAHQVDVMAGRLTALLRGEAPAAVQAMEVPQLDEISRRAQERLLMNQVVREILSNLAGVEQKLDGFFRDPAGKVGDLPGLKAPLKQIEGALTILGEMRAVEVLRECERKVAEFAEPAQSFEQKSFEDVANKLSALGFFVEQLRHGPADLDAILNPKPVVGLAEQPEYVRSSLGVAEMAQMTKLTRTAIDALRDNPANEELREEIKQNLETIRVDAELMEHTALEQQADAALAVLDAASPELVAEEIDRIEQAVDSLPPLAPPLAAPSAEAARLVEASSEAIDAELLGIFLEEAHEVLETIGQHLPLLAEKPHDHEMLTVIRRAFHTLKGSGRMVGLTDLGEAAWSVEQVMNHWLKLDQGATPTLLEVLDAAHALFADWVRRLEAREAPPSADSPALGELQAACVRLMDGGEPAAAVAVPLEPVVEVVAEAAAPSLPEPAVVESIDVPVAALPGEPDRVDDSVVIGDLSLSRMVYDIYQTEAKSHLAVLAAERDSLLEAPPSREILRASHTLGGVSGTIGIRSVNLLGKGLEHALERFAAAAVLPDAAQHALLTRVIESLHAMLDEVARCRMPESDAALLADLEALTPHAAATEPVVAAEEIVELPSAVPTEVAAPSAVEPGAPSLPALEGGDVPFADARRKLRIHDDLDRQLLPIFLEEGGDLLREIGTELRAWRTSPGDGGIGQHLQRLLHTLKGSARMAGAMRMGELVHGMESRIIQATRHGSAPVPAFLDELDNFFDRALTMLDSLVRIDRGEQVAEDVEDGAHVAEPSSGEAAPVPTAGATAPAAAEEGEASETAAQRAQLRVRAELVDELINEAGEMAIARARIEGEMRTLKSSLLDLTENVIRLRQQLREIEIQAESQMQSQMTQLQEVHQDFDPLEMDRFTRFQELTRMMAESVNDVTTVQHNLLRNVDNASTALTAQSRLNRELSQSLMSVRMVPFNSIVDRIYRVVRQVAKELDKRVNLEVRGGQLEIDRSVLDKMIGPIEHLLRNSIAHGIESREERRAAGKPEIGEITMSLTQQGNEIVIELVDDGAGLNYARIRAKAIEQGLLGADEPADERRLTQFIFSSGLSTATQVSEVAGRGVGMDVVRAEAASLGGRIEVNSRTGQGTRFRIFLPLTLAVTQALLIRSGSRAFALPSSMIEQVMELRPEAAQKIRAAAGTDWLDTHYPWYYLAQLLGEAGGAPAPARRHWILLLKGADQHIALEVDGLVGNQEIVVKNIGPQLARVPGVSGATVLNDGEIALILNPLALASRETRSPAETAATLAAAVPVTAAPAVAAPTVMVVDDSLTVRKIASRLLTREGYQVATAKDGVDALEQLLDLVPAAMLVDIEMPRMDGFELTRNVRADARLKDVPIIMITSRTAEKHRNYAQEIGVNEYLGKPYDEETLLGLIRGFVEKQKAVEPAAT